MGIEIWKDISGYDGYYQVSSLGNIRSVDREIEQLSRYGHTVVRSLKGRAVTPTDNGKGYKIVGLTRNGRRQNYYVHKLVADAFVPNPSEKTEINHKDFNKANNSAENLEWVTHLENIRYSIPNMCKAKPGSRLSETGEKYIHFQKGRYRLVIKRVIDRSYRTLAEAVAQREVMIGW